MGVLTLIAAVLALVATFIFFFYRRSFRFWAKHGFPFAKPYFPLGNATGFVNGQCIGDVVSNVYKSFPQEKFVGFWLLFRPVLMVRDPELIKSIFVRDFMSFHDRGIYVNEKEDPLSAHLFSIGGAKWKNLRVKMTPTFTSGKMKMMFPILVECSQHLVKALEVEMEKGEVVEVKELSARYTTDIISLCAFGIETNSLKDPDAEFRYYGQKILEPTINNILRGLTTLLAPDVTRILKLRQMDKGVSKFFLNAMRETMDYREENKVRRNDFMDLLIQLKKNGKLDDVADVDDKDSTKLTFEQAAAQAFVFFVAGFETSSTTMQFMLYEMAKNPEMQKRVRQEINAALQKTDGLISYDCVSSMEYLGRVVDETLRLYPPVPFLQRECNKDYVVPGTKLVLPRGTQTMVDIYGLQRDPLHYSDPQRFDPDRFTDEEKAKRHHYVYLPFGEGPRNCIGMRFGLMQTKVGIITLLQSYEFHVAKETPLPLVLDHKSFVLSPKGGMHLRVTKI